MISTLKQSPMFQLSLSSKELFHSNFISWLIINYKEEFSPLLSVFIENKHNRNFKIISVKREEKHTDISIYFKDTHGNIIKLIIENKVKSLPTYSQLLRYTSFDKNEYYVLLSLAEPSILQNKKIFIKEFGKQWNYINYASLAEIFKSVTSMIMKKNQYHGQILNDYITMIQALNDVILVENNTYSFYNQSGIELLNRLREIRFHSFYLKVQHEILVGKLIRKLKKEKPHLNYVPKQHWEHSKTSEVFVDSGFTNETGLSEVKYVICERFNSPIILGVQVQGNQFRLFVESKKELSLKIAQKLFEERVWFDFSILSGNPFFEKVEYPKQKGKNFNAYGETFRYRYIKVKEINIDELIDIIVDYVFTIHKNKDRIIQLIDEECTELNH